MPAEPNVLGIVSFSISLTKSKISYPKVASLIADSLNTNQASVTGGSLLKLTDVMRLLLDHQTDDENDHEDTDVFAIQLMNVTNAVFGAYTGWKEIPDRNSIKYAKVSSYLEQLDYAAYLWTGKETFICG